METPSPSCIFMHFLFASKEGTKICFHGAGRLAVLRRADWRTSCLSSGLKSLNRLKHFVYVGFEKLPKGPALAHHFTLFQMISVYIFFVVNFHVVLFEAFSQSLMRGSSFNMEPSPGALRSVSQERKDCGGWYQEPLLRVAVVGDDAAAGHGATDYNGWAAKMGKMLHEEFGSTLSGTAVKHLDFHVGAMPSLFV